MPPRPLMALPPCRRARSGVVSSMAQRLGQMSISNSACLRHARQRPSSGASFLNLDGDARRSSPTGSTDPRAPAPGPSPRDGGSRYSNATSELSRVLFDSEARRRMHERVEDRKRGTLERMAERKVSDDYARQMPRRWRVGDLYAPHDLSVGEAAKWRRPSPPTADVVDILGFHPVDEYRNFGILSEFMTSMGRIKHSRDTGLRPVNQRRMARAIRRAIGLGLHPSVHFHPQILATQLSNLPRQNTASGRPSGRQRI